MSLSVLVRVGLNNAYAFRHDDALGALEHRPHTLGLKHALRRIRLPLAAELARRLEQLRGGVVILREEIDAERGKRRRRKRKQYGLAAEES